MKVWNELYRFAIEQLKSRYDTREIRSIFMEWIHHEIGWSPTDFEIHRNDEVRVDVNASFDRAIQALCDGMPIQYVTNRAYFNDSWYFVDQRVLIPRPETAELVNWIAADVEAMNSSSQSYQAGADVGTGSGCILIELLKNKSIERGIGIDQSHLALEVARKNAQQHQVHANWVHADFLSPDFKLEPAPLDLIVSNPPYIARSEAAEMKPNVLQHEPHEALFPDSPDPLIFYRKLGTFAWEYLTEKGTLYAEINEAYPEEVQQLLKPYFSEVTIREDAFGKPRMVRARNKITRNG